MKLAHYMANLVANGFGFGASQEEQKFRQQLHTLADVSENETNSVSA